MTQEEFIKEAKLVHGDKYDYSKVVFKNKAAKVIIVCPIHGEFQQIPSSHLKGYGCAKCGKNKLSERYRLKQNELIERFITKHGDRYDYGNVEYKSMHEKIEVACKKHGAFMVTPHNHLKGSGCPLCYNENRVPGNKKTTEDFIEKSALIHNGKYDYSNTQYVNSKTIVDIVCRKHGEFKQTPECHLQGCGCPSCGAVKSKDEDFIFEYCQRLFGRENVEHRNKTAIKPMEIDIYIPSLKLGIEYNGLYWHSEKQGKDRNYHLSKLEMCKKNGIKLIQVFEDEFVQHKDIVLNKIAHIAGNDPNKQKIMGRKCKVKEIGSNTAKEFLNRYHIHGYSPSSVYLGCFHNTELVAVMSFKRKTQTSHEWELTRFASDYNYICQGVGGKMFKYFTNKWNPKIIKSFADRRWTVNEENNVYSKLGFTFDGYTKVDYRYYRKNDGTVRQHKFNFRKERLSKKYGLDMKMTESEMTNMLDYEKIYDCGLIRYVWKKNRE